MGSSITVFDGENIGNKNECITKKVISVSNHANFDFGFTLQTMVEREIQIYLANEKKQELNLRSCAMLKRGKV